MESAPLVPAFDAVIYLWVPALERLARLKRRERERHGAAIDRGGAMRQTHLDFMAWAAEYDTEDLTVRSRALHESWLATLPCPVLRLEGDLSTAERVRRVLEALPS